MRVERRVGVEPGLEMGRSVVMKSSFQVFEDLIEEEGLTYSVKLEGRTRASIYEDIDFSLTRRKMFKDCFLTIEWLACAELNSL